MPKQKRIKTSYTGVYYIHAISNENHGHENIFYIRYRKNGKLVEEKAGREHTDGMTASLASKIRNEKIKGISPSANPDKTDREVISGHSELTEKKWALFLDSATDGFSLFDSDLNLIEVNKTAMRFVNWNSGKKNMIGKNISEFAPDSEDVFIHKKLKKVIETGEAFSEENFIPPRKFREGAQVNLKAFKVGDCLGVITTDITDFKRVEKELELKNIHLEEINTALKVLLKKRESDKRELEESLIFNVKELVFPLLDKLKSSGLNDKQKAYLHALESNMNEIVAPFSHNLATKYKNLSPTEIQVANLVKRGESTKEIAELLNSNPRAIMFHRVNLRKKMGLKNKKINLRTFLLSLP